MDSSLNNLAIVHSYSKSDEINNDKELQTTKEENANNFNEQDAVDSI
jgi:hypothetical protein